MSYMMKMLQSFSNYLWPTTLHIITQLINHDKPLSTKYIFTKKKKEETKETLLAQNRSHLFPELYSDCIALHILL